MLERMASLWATPQATDNKRGEEMPLVSVNRPRTGAQAEQWATPQTTDLGDRSMEAHMAAHERHGTGATKPSQLQVLAENWATPTTQDSENDGPPSQHERNSLPLNAAAAFSSPQGPALDLTRLLRTYLSYSGPIPIEAIRNFLQSLLSGRRGKESSQSVPKSHRPRLNPRFTEWLMNLPAGWVTHGQVDPTSFGHWETACISLVGALLS